jgi:archaellum component FlaC
MDEELRTYLGEMEERMARRTDSLEERLVALMAAEVGSLHSEIGQVREAVTRVEDRLDRQAMMLAGGTKALGGLLEHVVSLDSNYARVMDEMNSLRARMDRLERKAS